MLIVQIKHFANKYKLTTDTVRYYEKEGLLTPTRQDNGYRKYDVTFEKKIKFILVLRKLGFSLQEIKQLLLLENKPVSPTCNQQTVQLFTAKIMNIEQQIHFYQQAVLSLQLVQTLMYDGKYEENKEKIALQIENMYKNLQEGRDNHETP